MKLKVWKLKPGESATITILPPKELFLERGQMHCLNSPFSKGKTNLWYPYPWAIFYLEDEKFTDGGGI